MAVKVTPADAEWARSAVADMGYSVTETTQALERQVHYLARMRAEMNTFLRAFRAPSFVVTCSDGVTRAVYR